MTKYNKGDSVVSTKNLGGFWESQVPAGTQGTVIEAPIFGGPKVQFTIEGFWNRDVVVRSVRDDEIR